MGLEIDSSVRSAFVISKFLFNGFHLKRTLIDLGLEKY